MNYEMQCQYAEKVVSFLNDIGIPTSIVPYAKGFIDEVEIQDGQLLVTQNGKASNILHEAGHLAIVPSRFRSYLNGNISHGITRAFNEIESFEGYAESSEYRKLLQTGDVEATAWAWAAGKYLNLPEDEIIRDSEYGGTGDEVRLCLSMRAYAGINGLANADFCNIRIRVPDMPVYPNLAFWLQK